MRDCAVASMMDKQWSGTEVLPVRPDIYAGNVFLACGALEKVC